MRVLIIAIGGALGALARHELGSLIARRWTGQFPLGTWIINLSGALAIGIFLTIYGERATIHPNWQNWRLLIAVGFLGAFTTFSTFEYETLRLILDGNLPTALLYVATSLLLGLLAVWIGVAIARRLLIHF